MSTETWHPQPMTASPGISSCSACPLCCKGLLLVAWLRYPSTLSCGRHGVLYPSLLSPSPRALHTRVQQHILNKTSPALPSSPACTPNVDMKRKQQPTPTARRLLEPLDALVGRDGLPYSTCPPQLSVETRRNQRLLTPSNHCAPKPQAPRHHADGMRNTPIKRQTVLILRCSTR